jgi:branched-chain amino acid transport system substrate-binding protein
LPNEANKKFVADFEKKYKSEPSFYAAQSYDAANLIASAVAAVKGKLSDKKAVQAALEKANFKSVRGGFKFGNNHYPIQNFYMQEVVKNGDKYTLKTVATAVENGQDVHHTKCNMK